MDKAYFEDFHVGDCTVTPGRTVTETDLVVFAYLTGDWHPLHTNVEYATGTAFGQRIAQGQLILAISTGLMFRDQQWVSLPDATMALWGLDKVRFMVPTFIGDTVHGEIEIVRLTEVDGGRGLLVMDHRVKNQRGEEVVTFTLKLLLRRRPQRGSDGG